MAGIRRTDVRPPRGSTVWRTVKRFRAIYFERFYGFEEFPFSELRVPIGCVDLLLGNYRRENEFWM